MYLSKNLDHLGIVSAVCREFHFQEEIDNILGVDPRQKVTCGQAVKAMILNSLGFVDRPLYLFPEFMKTKPVEILIEQGLEADDFNDDVLGRTLDKLYNAGCEEIFMRIAANAHQYGCSSSERDLRRYGRQGLPYADDSGEGAGGDWEDIAGTSVLDGSAPHKRSRSNNRGRSLVRNPRFVSPTSTYYNATRSERTIREC